MDAPPYARRRNFKFSMLDQITLSLSLIFHLIQQSYTLQLSVSDEKVFKSTSSTLSTAARRRFNLSPSIS
ncbi:hypothetical protein Pfo_027357, partial [Paulownia fortunei]